MKQALVRTPDRQPLSPVNREMGSGGPKQSLGKPHHSPLAKAKLPTGSPLKPSVEATTPKHRADTRGKQRSALGEEDDIPVFSLDMLDGHPSMPLQVSSPSKFGVPVSDTLLLQVEQDPKESEVLFHGTDLHH